MITSRQQLEAVSSQLIVERATLDTHGQGDHLAQHVVLGGKIAATVIRLCNLASHRTLTSTLGCLLASLFALLAFLLALARLVLEGEVARKERLKDAGELMNSAVLSVSEVDSVGKLQS